MQKIGKKEEVHTIAENITMCHANQVSFDIFVNWLERIFKIYYQSMYGDHSPSKRNYIYIQILETYNIWLDFQDSSLQILDPLPTR